MNNMTGGQSCTLMWLGSSTKGFKENVSLEHNTIINPNPTGGGVFSTPPHGFLIAISLFYEKLSSNSLSFSFYMSATYFWKKSSKW